MFENRRYVIVPTSKLHLIDFSQVMEDSADTCRLSMDQSQSFVKYEGAMPASVAAIDGRSAEYTHEEIMEILGTPAWTITMESK